MATKEKPYKITTVVLYPEDEKKIQELIELDRMAPGVGRSAIIRQAVDLLYAKKTAKQPA